MKNEKSIKIGTSLVDFMNSISYGDLVGHVIIEGGPGSGKTNLAMDILRQHHNNGGRFCYFSPRENLAVLDTAHRIDADLTIMRQVPDTETLQAETIKAITDFINNRKNLVITTERSLSVPRTSAILDAMRRDSMNMDPQNRNDLPSILIIDEADFISDTSIAKLLEVARSAHMLVITIFHYAVQHLLTVQNTATRILMGSLDTESIEMWREITGLNIAPNTISIGQAWVISPDRDVPTIHDVWDGYRACTMQEQ